nr:MAG TPA: hypothetical protein [Caudoviricetes sp.]
MGLFVEKASHHAGCFEFVKANKFGRRRAMTGFASIDKRCFAIILYAFICKFVDFCQVILI